jgi:hypothetical protein
MPANHDQLTRIEHRLTQIWRLLMSNLEATQALSDAVVVLAGTVSNVAAEMHTVADVLAQMSANAPADVTTQLDAITANVRTLATTLQSAGDSLAVVIPAPVVPAEPVVTDAPLVA